MLQNLNLLHWILVASVVLYLVLLLKSPKKSSSFAMVVILAIAVSVILMPFAWLICAAFKDSSVMQQYSFLPPPDKISSSTINLKNFSTLFEPKSTLEGEISFFRYIINSVFLASTSTFLSMVFSSMGGYALSKYKFRGQGVILTFMLASLTIPSVVLLAPNYEVIYELGWMNSFKALILPGCVSTFGIFLYRQAMVGVPDELIEAGRIDGCSEFRIYLRLIMPLVRPMTGAFCLISFLASWNSFITPNIFLQSQDKMPLPVVLNQYIGQYSQHYGVFLAGTLIAIIPPAILFFALQREFISGLASGAVKQ